MNQPLGVKHVDMFAADAQRHVKLGAGNARGPGPYDDHLHVFQLAARQFCGVQQGGAGDDGRSVLVVMEHGDVHFLAEAFLHHEAFRGLDVFQVDGAEGGLHGLDNLDQFFRLLDVQFNVKNVNVREHLEQNALAFHHRLGRIRTDVAQAQNGGAVGHHAHQVGASCVQGALGRILLDAEAGFGYARRIGKRQIPLRKAGLAGQRFHLAGAGLGMVLQGI